MRARLRSSSSDRFSGSCSDAMISLAVGDGGGVSLVGMVVMLRCVCAAVDGWYACILMIGLTGMVEWL